MIKGVGLHPAIHPPLEANFEVELSELRCRIWWSGRVSLLNIDIEDEFVIGTRESGVKSSPSIMYESVGTSWRMLGILVGGFKHFLFSPLFGEDEPILTNVFRKGLVQPPTSISEFVSKTACQTLYRSILFMDITPNGYKVSKFRSIFVDTYETPWNTN